MLLFALLLVFETGNAQEERIFVVGETVNITEDSSGDIHILGEVSNQTNFTKPKNLHRYPEEMAKNFVLAVDRIATVYS